EGGDGWHRMSRTWRRTPKRRGHQAALKRFGRATRGAVCTAARQNRFLLGSQNRQIIQFLDPTRWPRVGSPSPWPRRQRESPRRRVRQVSVVTFTRSPTGIRNNRRQKTLHESVEKRQKTRSSSGAPTVKSRHE